MALGIHDSLQLLHFNCLPFLAAHGGVDRRHCSQTPADRAAFAPALQQERDGQGDDLCWAGEEVRVCVRVCANALSKRAGDVVWGTLAHHGDSEAGFIHALWFSRIEVQPVDEVVGG